MQDFLLFKAIYENTVKSFSYSVKHFVRLVTKKNMKVVKDFDISKQKGESYPDYPDRESRRTDAHLPSRCHARTIII
jgi:hypothetical protein